MTDPLPTSAPSTEAVAGELAARLVRPQRHRLLQGYPSLPQMRLASARTAGQIEGRRTLRGALITDRARLTEHLAFLERRLAAPPPAPSADPREEQRRQRDEMLRPQWASAIEQLGAQLSLPDPAEPPFVELDATRDLLVGVIPHTQCTPRVEGCGFCTFPHDAPDKRSRGRAIAGVEDEIVALLQSSPELQGRKVTAVYFGGGTANLAAPDQIARLFAALAARFDVRGAEVSLEGIPKLFTSWFHAPLDMLARLAAGRRRISMGIQTFDRAVLERMGRADFGDEKLVRKLVARCRARDITTSGDLLFGLPGQTLAAMTDDVDRAIDAGLDQICLYHLVLHEGLGTAWSKDPALVAAMPDNETACAHWLALRDRLLGAGFVQTTVTNFERKEVAEGDRAFVYERASFSPEKTDGVGFGPLSLSVFVDRVQRRAVKLVRRKDLRSPAWSGHDLYFPCEGDDLRLLFVTRSLAKGSFDARVYADFCGSDLAHDFPHAIAALTARGLIESTAGRLSLTPRGMFFSDAVVATFVAEKARPRTGEGVRTHAALEEPLLLDYDGMG